MKSLAQLTPITLLVLASCVSTANNPSRIDSALLSELSPSTMAGVVEARATKNSAEDALAKAKRDTQWAEEQVELTRSNLKVVRTELDDAKLGMVTAERSGTVSQLEAAKKSYDYAVARADEVRERLSLRKREFEYAKLAQKLALENYRLKTAEVELQKAEAVQELDRVAAKQVPVKDYRRQVRYHETEVELAQVRLAAMASEIDEARQEYEAFRAKAEALKGAS